MNINSVIVGILFAGLAVIGFGFLNADGVATLDPVMTDVVIMPDGERRDIFLRFGDQAYTLSEGGKSAFMAMVGLLVLLVLLYAVVPAAARRIENSRGNLSGNDERGPW